MNKLFVYGILKRGLDLDLAGYEAKFLGKAQLPGAILYGIHPLYQEPDRGELGRINFSGVGLRFTDDLKKIAHGEVFEIPDHLWSWLDSIEHNGFSYTRKIVPVCITHDEDPENIYIEMDNAWVYEHTFPGMKYQYPIENGVF